MRTLLALLVAMALPAPLPAQCEWQSPVTLSESAESYGFAAACLDDWVFVAAPQSDGIATNAGAVFTYRRSGNAWSLHQVLEGSDLAAAHHFGISLGADGDCVAIGRTGTRSSGPELERCTSFAGTTGPRPGIRSRSWSPATGASTRDERFRAAMLGYVRFARSHPELFKIMFSPDYSDHKDGAMLEAAQDSYGVLAEIADGLDWDKADSPDAQWRTEIMLWSLVHGYATLMNTGQIRDREGGAPPPGILEVVPDFGYRQNA